MFNQYANIKSLFTIFILSLVLLFPTQVNSKEIFADAVNHQYISFLKSIKPNEFIQSNSLKLSTTFYSKLLDSSVRTSPLRIIIMVNSDNGLLNRLFPSNDYMRGNKNENWYWHSFILYNGKVFDFRFTLAPCNLRKYFDIVWNNDKNINNFSIYSIQMKDFIYFMNIRRKRNKAYFDYMPVSTSFLIDSPLHLSKKKAKHVK